MSAMDEQNLWLCPICSKDCVDPRSLPCLHTFCLRCVERRCQGGAPSAENECPMCGQKFRIPADGCGRLLRNLFVERLAGEKRGTLRKCAAVAAGASCEGCGKEAEKATVYCSNCEKRLCSRCGKRCEQRKGGGHKVVKMAETTSQQQQDEFIGGYCSIHDGEITKMYCRQCELPVCRNCCAARHRGHPCIDVRDATEKLKTQMIKDAEKVRTRLLDATKKADSVERARRELSLQLEKAEADIRQIADEIKRRVDEDARKLLQQLESLRAQREKEIRMVEESVKSSLKSTEHFLRYSHLLINQGTPAEVTRSASHLLKRANELQRLLVTCASTPVRSHRIDIVKSDLSWLPKTAEDKETGSALLGKLMDRSEMTPNVYVEQPKSSSVNAFEVEIDTTDPNSLNLRGRYHLTLSPQHIELLNIRSGKPVVTWRYEQIRNFGFGTEKFAIVAGSSAGQASGVFVFFTSVAEAIREALNDRMRQLAATNDNTTGESNVGGCLPSGEDNDRDDDYLDMDGYYLTPHPSPLYAHVAAAHLYANVATDSGSRQAPAAAASPSPDCSDRTRRPPQTAPSNSRNDSGSASSQPASSPPCIQIKPVPLGRRSPRQSEDFTPDTALPLKPVPPGRRCPRPSEVSSPPVVAVPIKPVPLQRRSPRPSEDFTPDTASPVASPRSPVAQSQQQTSSQPGRTPPVPDKPKKPASGNVAAGLSGSGFIRQGSGSDGNRLAENYEQLKLNSDDDDDYTQLNADPTT